MKLSKRERFVDFAIGVIALAIYLLTLAPTITWRNNGADSGDLVSAALTLGIPHPTGYPLFTIFAAILSHLPFGEPAKNVSAFSAIASAGAVSLISHAGRNLIPNSTPPARWIPPSFALAFAFAPALWSQATIAEVNALAILLVAALFAVLFSDSPHRLIFAAAVIGIGLTHHLTIMLLVPPAVLLLAQAHWTRSQFVRAALVLIAPLALYLYLPLRASANPPINWGNPATLEGFLWVITGAPYRSYLLAVSPSELFTRLALTARFLFDQFTVVGIALGLWGAAQMGKQKGVNTQRRLAALLLTSVLFVAYAVVYASLDSFVYLVPAFLVFVFWMMYGMSDLIERLWKPTPSPRQEESRKSSRRFEFKDLVSSVCDDLRGVRGELRWTWRSLMGTALVVFLVLFPLYNLAINFNSMNVSSDYAAYDYAKKIFAELPRQAVIISNGDEHFFALEYYRYAVAKNQSEIIVVSAELLQYSWYFDQVRRMMPNVNASPETQADRLVKVMDAGLTQGRGVYTTLRDERFLQYAMEHRDGYYRILGRLQ